MARRRRNQFRPLSRRGNTEGHVAGSPKGGKRGTVRPAGTKAPVTDTSPEPGQQFTPPPPPRQSGGTSGDLTIPDYQPETPTKKRRPRPAPRRSQPSPISPLLETLNDLLSPDPNRRSLVSESVLEPLTDLARDAGREIRETAKGAVELPKQRVSSFGDRPTLGTPTTAQLVKAAQADQLRTNQKGKVTVPATRRAARELQQAKQDVQRSGGGIEGITHGPQATRFANALAKYTGINPRAIGAWVQAEGGGWGGSGVSGGEAGKNNWLGVGYPGHQTPFARSPHFNTTPERAAKATADWMRGLIGDEYDYGAAPSIETIIPRSKGKGPQAFLRALADSGWGTTVEHVAQNLATIRNRPADPDAVRNLRAARQQAERLGIGTGGPGRPKPRLGQLIAGPGVDLSTSSPAILQLGRVIAGQVGEPLTINSAARPGSITTSGNVSDHSSGNALDIHALSTRYGTPADEEKGNRIAYETVMAAGGGRDLAEQIAAEGGAISFTNQDGVRVQVIWRSDVGGDHHNHVHVGISGATGDARFEAGVGSFTGGLTSGQVGQLTEATGMSPGQIDAAVAQDPKRGDRLLRGLGYTVVPAEVPISELLRTLSLDPDDVAAGGEEREGGGTIARLLARRRL